jgi:hypothetical protein
LIPGSESDPIPDDGISQRLLEQINASKVRDNIPPRDEMRWGKGKFFYPIGFHSGNYFNCTWLLMG